MGDHPQTIRIRDWTSRQRCPWRTTPTHFYLGGPMSINSIIALVVAVIIAIAIRQVVGVISSPTRADLPDLRA